MSRTPNFFVERYNSELNKYEFQHPLVWDYSHTKRVPADLFPYNGCHDLFSIVEGKGYSEFPNMKGIHYGLPKDVCEEILNEYQKYNEDEDGSIDYTPKVRWFTYADMYIYFLKHPKVSSYSDEEDEGKVEIDNPIVTLKNRVDAFLEVMDGWSWEEDYSFIRIVYWID